MVLERTRIGIYSIEDCEQIVAEEMQTAKAD